MPGPIPVEVPGDAALPARVDVVVIGGGIIGAATTLELAERGLSVALCEKGHVAGEQSSRNWGWVRISMRDPREIPLMAEALRLWPGLDARTGRETGFRRAGIAFSSGREDELAQYADWLTHLDPTGLESRMLSAAETAGLLPGCRLPLKGALWTPGDGRAEPQKAAPAIALAARDRGAAILTPCAVRGIERSAGRVSGVITEHGPIACDAVVLAGGAWSRLLAGAEGIDLPQLKVLNSVLRTTPVAGGPVPTLWTERFAIRKRLDEGYTIASFAGNVVDIVPDSFRLARSFLPALRAEWRSLSFRLGPRFLAEARQPRRWALDAPGPFEACRVLDPAPSERVLRRALADAQAAFPALAGARAAQHWAGYIDVTPDAVPVISAIDALPGFHIATGFSGHGFGIGPGAGRLMADLVTGDTPCVDPTDFRFSRFTDGTPMTVVAGV